MAEDGLESKIASDGKADLLDSFYHEVFNTLGSKAIFIHSDDGAHGHAPMPDEFFRLVCDIVIAALTSLGVTATYDVLKTLLVNRYRSDMTSEGNQRAKERIEATLRELKSLDDFNEVKRLACENEIARILKDYGWPIDEAKAVAAIILNKLLTSESRPNAATHTARNKYRQILSTRFNTEELRDLCFVLDISYEDLPGDGRSGKARELVSFLERHDRIPDLLAAGADLRPEIPWKTVLEEDN